MGLGDGGGTGALAWRRRVTLPYVETINGNKISIFREKSSGDRTKGPPRVVGVEWCGVGGGE